MVAPAAVADLDIREVLIKRQPMQYGAPPEPLNKVHSNAGTGHIINSVQSKVQLHQNVLSMSKMFRISKVDVFSVIFMK